MRKPDFRGWVTKNDILCEDGVVIRHDAFAKNDNRSVPLMWQHDYNSPENVLGSIILHNADEGVYGDGYFNDTTSARHAKQMLLHGDVTSMSIGARRVKKDGANVIDGDIYEVSLVLKGANPGAVIEQVLTHSAYGDYPSDDTMIIHTGIEQEFELEPEDNPEEIKMKTFGEVLETLTEDQQYVIEKAIEYGEESLTPEEQAVMESLDEDQFLAAQVMAEVYDGETQGNDGEKQGGDDNDDNVVYLDDYETQGNDDDEVYDDEDEAIAQSVFYGEDDTLKHNAFYGGGYAPQPNYVDKEEVNELIRQAAAGRASSISGVLLQSGIDTEDDDILQHGISNIDVIFPMTQLQRGIQAYNPGAKNVDRIMGMFSATPKSRIKNIYADLTDEDARAKGYIKGNEKVDQKLIKLFYRETTPTTVYLKTALDRDDIIDIQENGIDALSFLKQVQLGKYKETLLKLFLFGDKSQPTLQGRPNPEYVDPDNIRPITTDDDLYTIKIKTNNWTTVVDDVKRSLPAYQGSGQPVMLINPFDIPKLATLKDKNGHYLYGSSADANRVATDADIAAYFGCKELIPYLAMPQGQMLIGNLGDYVIGAVGGQQVVTFEQFDIDFNQQKTLMEGRLSGAILTPKSFIFVTVNNPDETDQTVLDFTDKALKQHPAFTVDSGKEKTPGKNYKSEMSKPDAGTTSSSAEGPVKPGIGG